MTSKLAFYKLKGLNIKPLKNSTSLIIIVFLSVLLYANTFTHEFALDDVAVITKNTFVQKGLNGIPDILTRGSWDGFQPELNMKIYRPFQLVLFAIQYEFFELNPTPYHIIHVLSYALLNCLIFLLLKQFWRSKHPFLALLITVFFIVHPVHSEVVANLKGSADLLAMLNAIFSFLCLFYFVNKRKSIYLFIACIFYLLSLFSKEVAFTYIVIFPLALFYFTELKIKSIIKYTLPFLGIILCYFVIRYVVFKGESANTMTLTYLDNVILLSETISQNIGTRLYGLGKNLQLLFFPYPLRSSYLYSDIPIYEAYDFVAFISFLCYALLTCIGFYFIRKKSILIFGLLYFLITIALFSNIGVMMPSIVSERWLLIPSLGFCICIGYMFYRILNDAGTFKHFFKDNIPVLTALVVILLLFSYQTFDRNLDWKNNTTLFAADIKTCPNNTLVLRGYGASLLSSNDIDKVKESVTIFKRALELIPKSNKVMHNLGKAYYVTGDIEKSIEIYEQVVKENPFKYESVFALGLVYNTNKQYEEALTVLSKLINVPGYEDSEKLNNQLLTSYKGTGLKLMASNSIIKIRQSIEYFKKASILAPNDLYNLHNLGKAHYLLGDLKNAIACYKYIYKAKPNKYDSAFALAVVYNANKDYLKALEILGTLEVVDDYKNNTSFNQQVYKAYIGLGREDLAKDFVPK